MKNLNNIKIIGFLTSAIFWSSFSFGASAGAQTVKPIFSSTPTPTPQQTLTPKPTPAVSPTVSPTAPQYKSTGEVQARIQNVLARPELRRGQVGVKIVSLDTGKTIFETNAEKYFMPASNMKSYTIAAALERLTPDFRFATSVFAPAPLDANGIVRGDLTVFGRGDVSFSTAFYDGDYYRGIDALAQKIAQSGVKRVEGNLIGDESYFTGSPIPNGWEWDDLQWYYGAEISALPVDDNAVDLKITPNAQLGMPCVVTISPTNSAFTVVNLSQTVSAGYKRSLEVVKKLDSNVLEIRGTMPSDDKGFTGSIAVTKPAQIFTELLKRALQQKGVVVAGQARIIDYKTAADAKRPLPARNPALSSSGENVLPGKNNNRVEIARFDSPPLSVIAAKTLKPSQNTYTETILRALGEQVGDKTDPKKTSAERGLEVVRNFLLQAGISADSVVQSDGSGLSRHDLITPASAVQLYTYMSNSRYANVWRDALTVAAVDGTLQNRFKGTAAAGNVRGKTGTIDQVSSLSGYLTSASGERFVFSIIVNGVGDGKLRQAAIDEIVLSVANFSGKTN